MRPSSCHPQACRLCPRPAGNHRHAKGRGPWSTAREEEGHPPVPTETPPRERWVISKCTNKSSSWFTVGTSAQSSPAGLQPHHCPPQGPTQATGDLAPDSCHSLTPRGGTQCPSHYYTETEEVRDQNLPEGNPAPGLHLTPASQGTEGCSSRSPRGEMGAEGFVPSPVSSGGARQALPSLCAQGRLALSERSGHRQPLTQLPSLSSCS